MLEAQKNTEFILEEERKANQLLVQAQQNIEHTLIEEQLANKRLTKAQKRTKRVLLAGIFGLIIMAMLAGTGFNFARETRIAADLELEGVRVQQQFENDPLGGMLKAMKIARQLQEQVSDGCPLEKYPALNPMLALRSILVNIKERNQFQYSALPFAPQQVKFSPNAQYFATAGYTVALWDSKGKKIAEFHGKKSGETSKCQGSCIFSSVSFNSDNTLIAAAQSDGSIVLLKISGQKLVKFKEFQAHSDLARSVSFNPNGNLLATASGKENEAFLWNLSGEKIAEFKGYTNIINSVSFSPNGKIFATSGIDSTIKLWNLKGQQVGEFKLGQNNSKLKAKENFYPYNIVEENRPRNYVNWMSFSPDGKKLAAACNDGMIRL
ncbi:MAG: hypothetical protein RMY34_22630 [Aulosira sp. DedQUE10]|nr:hypothetical protein [Aulosira sp. DedQUE10]